MTKEIKIETLWEINTPQGLFAEAFTTGKGTFVTISRKSGNVTITEEDAYMILNQLKIARKK